MEGEAPLDPPVPSRSSPLILLGKGKSCLPKTLSKSRHHEHVAVVLSHFHLGFFFVSQQYIPETRTSTNLHLCLRALPAWSLLWIRTAWGKILSASLSHWSWQTLLVDTTLFPIQSRFCLKPCHWALRNNYWAIGVDLCTETICHSGITHPVSRASVNKDKGSGAP